MPDPKPRTVLELDAGAIAAYYEWLKSARHGDVLVYWVGDLQYDRQAYPPKDDPGYEEAQRRLALLGVVADRVFDDAKSGELILTQLRLGPSRWEYRAGRFITPEKRNRQGFTRELAAA